MLKCDICGGQLSMDSSGDFAECVICGMKHTKDRIKAKAQEIVGVEKNNNIDSDEKQISNWEKLASNEFDNGNYKEAYKYYCKILEKNTVHWIAIYRKGLCDGWQSNLKNINTKAIIGGINEAIKLLYSDETMADSSKAHHLFTIALEFSSLVCAVNNLVIEDYKERCYVKNDTEWKTVYHNRSTACSLLECNIGMLNEFIYQNHQNNSDVESFANKICEFGHTTAKNTITKIRFKTREEWDSFLNRYKEVFADAYPTDEAKVASNNLSYATDQLSNNFNTWKANYQQKIEEQLRKEKEERIAKYWAEHAFEKQQYDARLTEIDSEIKMLEVKSATYDSKISKIKNDLSIAVPGEEEVLEIKEQQSDLMCQKSKLGLFAIKQKKQLQIQIDALQMQINSLEETVNQQKKVIQADIATRVASVETERKPIADRISALQQEQIQINAELTKDR